MTLRKLEKQSDGSLICPVCGRTLMFVDGGAVRVVDGQLDMENIKPKYECHACGVYYREVLQSGYYDVFSLDTADRSPLLAGEAAAAAKAAEEMKLDPAAPLPLPEEADGHRRCPRCRRPLRTVEGGAVRVVDGRVDMENVKPKYECDRCGVFYREILNSGYYHAHPQTEEDRLPAKKPVKKKAAVRKKIRSTGELPPLPLKRDKDGRCACPRCGEMMTYVEGQPVHLVNGKPDMEDVLDHFSCTNCHSVYRRIVNTEYFQWNEK